MNAMSLHGIFSTLLTRYRQQVTDLDAADDQDDIDRLADASQDTLIALTGTRSRNAAAMAIKIDELINRYGDFGALPMNLVRELLLDARHLASSAARQSTEFQLALHAYRHAEATLAVFERDEYRPQFDRTSAALDALSHTQVVVRGGATWTTATASHVDAAKRILAPVLDRRDAHWRVYRRLLAGHWLRERAGARIRAQMAGCIEESDRLGSIMAAALHKVLNTPAATIADIDAKLTLLVEVQEEDGARLFPVLCADVRRVVNQEAK